MGSHLSVLQAVLQILKGRRLSNPVISQVVGEIADEVYLMVAGFKLELKK